MIKFLRGPRPQSQLWCALASLGQSITHVKIWGGSTPQRPKCSLPQNVCLCWSIWTPITFLFVEQSSRNFFLPTWKGFWFIKYLSDLQYVDQFRRYSRSKSNVVKNRAEFGTFFSPSQILGGMPSKTHTYFITPDSRHVVWIKFCGDTPIARKL